MMADSSWTTPPSPPLRPDTPRPASPLTRDPEPPVEIPKHYVVILSGTHVTGKETLAINLGKRLDGPWVKAEGHHNSAYRAAKQHGARLGLSNEDVGNTAYSPEAAAVFARILLERLVQVGLRLPLKTELAPVAPPAANPKKNPWAFEEEEEEEKDQDGEVLVEEEKAKDEELLCVAVITAYAMRAVGREAIRSIFHAHGVRAVFVILQIPEGELPNRTLGAEEEELKDRILAMKAGDLELPKEGEKDTRVLDAMMGGGVNVLLPAIEQLVREMLVVE